MTSHSKNAGQPARLAQDGPAIEVVALTKRFGTFTAVDAVSFTVPRGEIFGYLGANGAGKSTTIKMLCGLLRCTSGRAAVGGHDVDRNPRAAQAVIGYMSQKFSLYLDLPVRANLEFFAGAYRIPQPKLRIAELAERLGIDGLFDQRTGDLPGGVRQKVALTSALLHEPSVVFLDEPTAGVDPESRSAFWSIIRDLSAAGKTVLVTTHYLDEAEGCDRVGLMVDGRLVALDTPAALKTTHVPGAMRAIRGPDLSALEAHVRARTGVIDVQPFGRALHVRTVSDSAADELTQWLRDAVPTAECRMIEPSLEDVFLQVVQTFGRGGAS